MAWKYGGAATLPPKAPLPQSPIDTGGPGHSSPGRGPSAKTSEDTAYPSAPPTKATDSLCCVVPVLPMPGRVQPAARADAAVVPLTVSWLNPAMSVRASSGGTACSHGCSGRFTGCPNRSVTERIGSGGHQVPSLISVADTLASSSGLTGLSPRVKDGLSRK